MVKSERSDRSWQQDEASVVVEIPSMIDPSCKSMVIGRHSVLTPDVEEFRGIPYATVEARWEHSILRTHLPAQVFDASKNGPKCPQPAEGNNTRGYQSHLEFPTDVAESEFECLNLTVSRPSATALQTAGFDPKQLPLPVYVYIHGGGYGSGAGSDPIWDPARLILQSIRIRQPIIVVNINYRLNIFGFAASTELLTLHERNRGCNFGLMDQATALRWVSANIAAFGGDANKITLGGQSAGATSVYSHALRALDTDEQPMFRSCIIQSPAAGVLGPFDMERADQKWSRLCSHLGLSNLSTRKRLSLLRSLPTDELLKAVGDLGWATFTLVADEITLSTRMYDMERDQRCGDGQSTEALAASIKRNPIPFNVLLGTTSCEGSIFSDSVSRIQTFDQLERLLNLVPPISNHKEVLAAFKINPGITELELQCRLYQLLTDIIFAIPAWRACRNLSHYQKNDSTSKCDVHVSEYLFETGNPFPGPFHGQAHHCVDLIYLFDCFHNALRQVDSQEQQQDTSRPPQNPSITTTSDTNPTMPVRSNEALVNDIQTQVLSFIASEQPTNNLNLALTPAYESTATIQTTTIYDQTRQSRTLDIQRQHEDPWYCERIARFRAVERFWPSALAVAVAIATPSS